MMKIQFFSVMPSPYQIELLSCLSDACDLMITVHYYTSSSNDREWLSSPLPHNQSIMPGCTISSLGNSAHINLSVLSEIRNADADLVVVSDYSAITAQVAMRYLSFVARPFVFWGEVPGFTKRGWLGSWARSQLQAPLRDSAGIAAIGDGAVEAYRTLFPGKPVFNIPYFCDLSRFAMADQSRSARAADDVTILFSGQLIDRKGVDVLIAAFELAARKSTRLRLKLLGSGPERAKYEQMVPEELARRVEFLGHKDPSDLPEEFSKADVFCLPSRHDGWGVVVNEALGAGLPIIVSDAVGAGRDLVQDGVNGFVTPREDVPALAEALLRLASDDVLRSEMAQSSRKMSEYWGIDEGVRRWREAANTILESRLPS